MRFSGGASCMHATCPKSFFLERGRSVGEARRGRQPCGGVLLGVLDREDREDSFLSYLSRSSIRTALARKQRQKTDHVHRREMQEMRGLSVVKILSVPRLRDLSGHCFRPLWHRRIHTHLHVWPWPCMAVFVGLFVDLYL